MTEPQPPDFVIRSYNSSVHGNIVRNTKLANLNQNQLDQFDKWSQNVATRDGLASGDVPVSGTGVTGSVSTNNVGVAPATSVAVQTTNMMVSQNFSSPDTVVAAGRHWKYDATDGNITLGCARVDCDGTQDALLSNEIPVVTGENILVACQMKWDGIAYAGSDPIVLGVQKYRKGRDPVTGGVTYLDVGGVDVASLESPAGDGAWGDGDLAGEYQVEAGVDLLRCRFSTTVTAGSVKWDEAVFLKLDLIDDAAVPGVGHTVDDIVRQLYGADGDSFTHNDAAVALGNTSAALTSANARLAAIEAEAGTGAIAGDDFLWTGEITTSLNWGGFYDSATPIGTYVADGADAVFVTAASPKLGTQSYGFDWQGADDVSDTDYQLVQVLLSSAPGTTNGFKAYIDILGRVSAGFGTYVRARIGSDGTYAVSYFNGSSFVGMNTGTCAVPGMGALLSLYCGDKASLAPRHFKLVANTVTICDFDELGSGSPLGASNRKWGWGGQMSRGRPSPLVVSQAKAPKINQWLGRDQ